MAPALLLHLVVSTAVAMSLGLMAGSITPQVSIISLFAGLLAALAGYRALAGDRGLFPGIPFFPGVFCGLLVFAGLYHFLFLLYYANHGLSTLHLNNFGDLTLHIQYIRHMANGNHFWPDNPGFSGIIQTYPLGMDLYNALWETLGVAIDSHLFVTGVVMTILAVSELYRWMGWWGVGAFFLNNGLANWQVLVTGELVDYQNGLAWKNFFLSLWITQRGFLFALPAGIYVIRMITGTLLGERTLTRFEKITCALLWAGLAWFHLHTFFIISLALGILILFYGKIRQLLSVIIPVLAVGIVFVTFSTNFFSQAGVIHLSWGWLPEKENLARAWLHNLGPWILLPLAAILLIFHKKQAALRPIAAVVAALFLVFSSVMVAPWDWDTIKVLLWLHLLMAWLAWRVWISRLSPAPATILACLLFFPGAISLASSFSSPGVQLYQASELSESRAALIDLPLDSVLAIAPGPNHPAMFWGSAVAMGYPGHIWSHGIDDQDRERLLDDLFRGRENWFSAARTMGVTHIYWGEGEKRAYGAATAPWHALLENISRSEHIAVYDLQGYLPGGP